MQLNLNVNGMHCKSCEMLIKDEISEISGIQSVEVDHKTGIGFLTASGEIDNALILKAIENAGYTGLIENPEKANGNRKITEKQKAYFAH